MVHDYESVYSISSWSMLFKCFFHLFTQVTCASNTHFFITVTWVLHDFLTIIAQLMPLTFLSLPKWIKCYFQNSPAGNQCGPHGQPGACSKHHPMLVTPGLDSFFVKYWPLCFISYLVLICVLSWFSSVNHYHCTV